MTALENTCRSYDETAPRPHSSHTLNFGTHSKFDTVYREHFDSMWRLARALGVREDQLDDVIQETFLIGLRKADGFEGRSSLRTWLTGILIRVAAKYRRARSTDELDDGHTSPVVPADRVLEQKQARTLLLAMLNTLTPKNREVWVLSEVEQMSAVQIGKILQTSSNTVSSRLRLARKQLEREMMRRRARQGAKGI